MGNYFTAHLMIMSLLEKVSSPGKITLVKRRARHGTNRCVAELDSA